MAFGGRQWAPYSSSSSSSTLSPLAPPFTVHRKPYDYAYDQPLRSDLVQAKPFYPHYRSGVGMGGPPWNGPFDEGSGGVGKLSSSSPSPWMGRAEMGPVASAAPQQDVLLWDSPTLISGRNRRVEKAGAFLNSLVGFGLGISKNIDGE